MALFELRVPVIGESIAEVTLSRWLKEDGSFVNLDEVVCEFESDKATLEFPSEAAGKLIHVAKAGEDLKIGALVAQIDTDSKEVNNSAVAVEKGESKATAKITADKKIPSPSAAKLMREHDLSSEAVSGSGKEGRITKSDVIQSLETHTKPASAPINPTPTIANQSKTITTTSFSRQTHSEKMSRMRRTIAKRLVSAKNETAMLTTFNEVDMSALMQLRNTYNEKYLTKYGIKIGFMSVFAKACAQVLLQMPEVNAMIQDEEIIFHEYADIAIAISTPAGLVVPPIRNVESLALHTFEYQLKELAEKAKNGKLSLEEMSGGTFTITNGGVFGSMMSTPIINQPQSAILGMHAIKDRPIAFNGQVVIRPMMYLALSYDHRIIDGSSSVSFLVKVKDLIEDPMRLFLEI